MSCSVLNNCEQIIVPFLPFALSHVVIKVLLSVEQAVGGVIFAVV